MFCPIHPRPVFITPNPDMSADLSWADVTKGTELQQEVVAGEGCLCVGHAAVVTCRVQRGNKTKNKTKHGVVIWPLNRRNSGCCVHNVGIICTHMSFEAEKVQSPHSLESLPFLQREETNISNHC